MKSTVLMLGSGILILILVAVGCNRQAREEESFARELSPGAMSGPSELLAKGQQAKSPEEKLKLFKQIVSAFPESSQADEAQFMIGFILKEDLNQPEAAAAAFRVLEEKYPNSEWLDDAESLLSESVQE